MIDKRWVLSAALVACGPGQRHGGDAGEATDDGGTGPVSDACAVAAAGRSYMGCEYWAVDLANAIEVLGSVIPGQTCGQTYGQGATAMLRVCALGTATAGLCDPPDDACPMGYTCQQEAVCVLDAQHAPFAIVVSNPQTDPVDVTVTVAGGPTLSQTVQAGEVKAIMPQPMFPDQSLDGTGRGKHAYRVTSTLPIVAYQFNPLDNVDVFSNDASLLIPRSAFDSDYYGMTWPTLDRRSGTPSEHDYRGYVTVVAWSDNTQIEVTPSAPVIASATQPALPAGAPATFTLDAFDTLNLEAKSGDLTGTRVHSAASTFGVFVGHEAAVFGESTPPDDTHTRGPCCADHLEEMAFPTSTWGKTFTIARSKKRTNENDIIRVLAQKPSTTVTFTPPPTSVVDGDCTSLGPGTYCTVKIMTDTAIDSTEPILVGHYLQSAIWTGGGNGTPVTTVGNGDPSLSFAVPTEQYRTDYTILVPNAYDANYLSISAGPTGTVTVDGVSVDFESAAGGEFRAARIPVQAGRHVIACPDHCGVEVYGYSDAVSYMFAGGLDLQPIVQ
jgi:hypothetical protein